MVSEVIRRFLEPIAMEPLPGGGCILHLAEDVATDAMLDTDIGQDLQGEEGGSEALGKGLCRDGELGWTGMAHTGGFDPQPPAPPPALTPQS